MSSLPRRRLLQALALVFLAALVRLWEIDAGAFAGDEAVHLARACSIARGEAFLAVGGPTTDGFPAPPTFPYLLALPAVLFGPRPLPFMVLIVLVNALSIGALYLALVRRMGRTVASTAGILLTCSPALVHHSVTIWNPDLILPLSALTLVLCMRELRVKSGWAAGGALFSAVLLTTIHYSGIAAVAAAGVTWLFVGDGVRKRLKLRAPWFAIGCWAVMLTPFFMALALGSPVGSSERAHAVGAGPRGVVATLEAAGAALGAGAACDSSGLAATGEVLGDFPYAALDGLLLLIALAGLLLVARRAVRGHRLALILSCWTGAGLIPLFLGLVPPRTHYLFVLTPCLAIGVGVAVAWARKKLGRAAWIPLVLIAALAVFAGLVAQRLFVAVERFSNTPAQSEGPNNHRGVPLYAKVAAVQRILDEGLVLSRYPTMEYVILYDFEGRKRGLTHTQHFRIPYWKVDLQLPLPERSRPDGYAAIFLGEPEAGTEVLERWRHGPLWVIRTTAPRR